jgi:hypothetical protein
MAISSLMNASTVSSISPPISNRVPPTARASFYTFFAAYGRLRSTVTLHNHSSGASMAPTLGYLSTPYPLPPPPASISYAYKDVSRKEFKITHLGVFRPSRVHAFSGCSNQCIQSQNSSAWRRVTTKLPVRENFLLEAVVTVCCKCPLVH